MTVHGSSNQQGLHQHARFGPLSLFHLHGRPVRRRVFTFVNARALPLMPVSSSNGLHGVHRAPYPQTSPYACQLGELRQGRSGGACTLPPACSTLHRWRGDTQLSILPLYNRPMRSLPYGPGLLVDQMVASGGSARSGGHALGHFGAGGRRCERHPALSLACAASWPTHDLSSTR